MSPGCVDGKYVAELDWTAWYRRLLEEATDAAPGMCVSNWEQWWAEKGYHNRRHIGGGVTSKYLLRLGLNSCRGQVGTL